MPPTHPPEFRRRAVELARQPDDDGNRMHPVAQLARDLEISESCLRIWMAAEEVEASERPGLTKAERDLAEEVEASERPALTKAERDLADDWAQTVGWEPGPSDG
jgi:transposase